MRFEADNVIAACYGCHQFLGSMPEKHREFFLKRLGQKRFDLLMLKANTPERPDYKAIKLWLDLELRGAAGMILGAKA